jgi:hypothetical protein
MLTGGEVTHTGGVVTLIRRQAMPTGGAVTLS